MVAVWCVALLRCCFDVAANTCKDNNNDQVWFVCVFVAIRLHCWEPCTAFNPLAALPALPASLRAALLVFLQLAVQLCATRAQKSCPSAPL